jgi:hypothetical protein
MSDSLRFRHRLDRSQSTQNKSDIDYLSVYYVVLLYCLSGVLNGCLVVLANHQSFQQNQADPAF